MPRVRYVLADGVTIHLDVSRGLARVLKSLDREQIRQERRGLRREVPLSQIGRRDDAITDPRPERAR